MGELLQYCSANCFNVQTNLFLRDIAGLAVNRTLMPAEMCRKIGEANNYLLPYWDIPGHLLNQGIQALIDNPQLLAASLTAASASMFAIRWITEYLSNRDKLVDKQRKGLYPRFIGLGNKSALTNRKFMNVANSKKAHPLDKTSIDRVTNTRIMKAVKETEELHVYRVLYRVQDIQLTILRKYNKDSNNLYFTDFENNNLRDLSYKEAISLRDYVADETNFCGEIKVGTPAYMCNPDTYYMIQLVDQSCSLWVLKEIENANLWAVQGEPTLRATCFGKVTEPKELHLIAFKKDNPGVTGRLLEAGEWGNYLFEEHKRNQPAFVSDKQAKAKTMVIDYVQQHFRDILLNYSDAVTINDFPHLSKFTDDILTWNADQVISFISSDEEDTYPTRNGIVAELTKLAKRENAPRILK